MKLTRHAVLLAALAALAWGGTAAADSGRAGDHANLDAILIAGDPAASAAFLNNDDAQAALKAQDADLYAQVFARAAEIKDISDLVHGLPSPSGYRQGLELRDGCVFCQSPTRLLAWAGETFPDLDAPRRAALRKAVLEWDALSPELRSWLGARGSSAGSWSGLGLKERHAAIKPWVDAQVDALMNENPSGSAEGRALFDRGNALNDYMPRIQQTLLWERLTKTRSAVQGLEKAQARLAAGGDPALKALLAQAQSADTLETRLTLLSRIFDGLGTPDTAVLDSAPPRPGQVFDAASRRSLADLLKSGLMREISGTWAGDELSELYRHTTLDLRIGVIDATSIGQYQPGGAITFNESFIQRFLKAKGRDIRDLSRDADLLRTLTIELTPLFVHEATHQRQFQWAEDSHVNEVGSQNVEVEAMQTETVFIMEKSMRDPSFLARLKADAKTPGLAAEALNQARLMNDGGLAAFRDDVNANYYPDFLSLEGDAWKSMQGKHSETIPSDYAAFRARLAYVNGVAQDHYNTLMADKKPDFSRRAEVPSPAQ